MTDVNISTTVAGKTHVKRGDYNAAEAETAMVPKDQGAGTAIRRGYICFLDTTTHTYKPTTGKAAGPCVISALPSRWRPANINLSGQSDGLGEDITAEDDEPTFNAVLECTHAVVKASGVIHPGHPIMSGAGGTVVEYDGTGLQYIIGTYLSLPGSSTDGAYIRQNCAVNDLVVIAFQGAM